MKKLLLFCVLVSVFSCSKDEEKDTNDPANDKIIGLWYLAAKTINGELQDFNNCDYSGNYTFYTDQTVDIKLYRSSSSGCMPTALFNSGWNNLGNGKYNITGNLAQTIDTVTFSSDGKTMTWTAQNGEEVTVTTFRRDQLILV